MCVVCCTQKKIVCCLGVMGNCLCRFEPFNHKVSANAKSGLRFYLFFFLDLVFYFLETLYQCHGFFFTIFSWNYEIFLWFILYTQKAFTKLWKICRLFPKNDLIYFFFLFLGWFWLCSVCIHSLFLVFFVFIKSVFLFN